MRKNSLVICNNKMHKSRVWYLCIGKGGGESIAEVRESVAGVSAIHESFVRQKYRKSESVKADEEIGRLHATPLNDVAVQGG